MPQKELLPAAKKVRIVEAYINGETGAEIHIVRTPSKPMPISI